MREKQEWADTWELGGRPDTKNSPVLPKPKGKTSQEDQGHNHCQDDPASGAVMICGGVHTKLSSQTTPTVLLHFHAFLCYSSVCPNNLLLPYFLSYSSLEMTPSNLLPISMWLVYNSHISYFYSFWVWTA